MCDGRRVSTSRSPATARRTRSFALGRGRGHDRCLEGRTTRRACSTWPRWTWQAGRAPRRAAGARQPWPKPLSGSHARAGDEVSWLVTPTARARAHVARQTARATAGGSRDLNNLHTTGHVYTATKGGGGTAVLCLLVSLGFTLLGVLLLYFTPRRVTAGRPAPHTTVSHAHKRDTARTCPQDTRSLTIIPPAKGPRHAHERRSPHTCVCFQALCSYSMYRR